MKLNYRERINGQLYQPVMIELDGHQVIDRIPISCGTCIDRLDCPDEVYEAFHGCKRWKWEKERGVEKCNM